MAEPKESVPYKDLKQELDLVLGRLQRPDIDIDEAVVLYKQAGKLLEKMSVYLEGVSKSIKK